MAEASGNLWQQPTPLAMFYSCFFTQHLVLVGHIHDADRYSRTGVLAIYTPSRELIWLGSMMSLAAPQVPPTLPSPPCHIEPASPRNRPVNSEKNLIRRQVSIMSPPPDLVVADDVLGRTRPKPTEHLTSG